jgi:hypothetical protein
MQARSFLILNGLVLLALILRLIISRRQPPPTPLNITKSPSKSVSKNQEAHAPPSKEKALNCYFMHNGLMIDAFEILGVPGGADRDTCYRAYVDLRRSHKAPAVIEDAWVALQQYF